MATKWACLGPGFICEDFFTAVQDNLPPGDHEFIAVASKNLTKARSFADKFKFKRAYDSYDDVAKDGDVEVVYIATLNITHAELSIKMLDAGKHVLCEKPMAMSLAEAKKVFEAAKRNKCVFMEAMWTRFSPAYAHIQKEIESGSLGNISQVQASFHVPIQNVARVNTAELGGGAVYDIGVYLITLACMIFKEKPVEIEVKAQLSECGSVDLGGNMKFTYSSGAVADLSYRTDLPAGDMYGPASIIGDKGTVKIDTPFWSPVKIETPSGIYEFPLKEGSYNFLNSAGLQYEAAAMTNTIREGKMENEVSSFANSEMVMTIIDEVRTKIGFKVK